MRRFIGTSLIEVLMSLFLLSLILLSWDIMQITALQTMQSAYHYNIAQQQLLTMTEHIKTNRAVNSQDFVNWQKQNKKVLPQGRGTIKGQYPFFMIGILWGNKSASECQYQIGNTGCLQLAINL